MRKGWEIKKLGEICKIQLGKTPYRKNEKFWDRNKVSGNIWLSIADLKHGKYIYDSTEQITDIAKKDVVQIPKNTLMLSFKLTLGRVSFAGTDLYTNEAIASLLNLDSGISKEFLFYYFSFLDWNKEAEGDVKIKGKTLNKEKLKVLAIPKPNFLEQQQIVSILDEAFVAIDQAKENLQRNLQNAKDLFQSELNRIFSSKGKGWTEKNLEEIALVFGRGKSKHRPRNDEKLYGGNYPFIQTGDVRNSDKFITQYSQTYNEVGLAQSKLWQKGTICITIAANIAETGILTFNSCFPDSMIGLVVDPKKADVNFAYYALQFLKSTLQLLGKGSAQDNINMGTFESQKFPFPSLEMQKEIVQQLDNLSTQTKSLEKIYQKKLDNLEELKKSILQKAFSGELTMKQSKALT